VKQRQKVQGIMEVPVEHVVKELAKYESLHEPEVCCVKQRWNGM
jgi:hypothetical protein